MSDKIETEFQNAVKWVNHNKSKMEEMRRDDQAYLYGTFKQAICGDNKQAQPYRFQFFEFGKWQAWESCKGMTSDEAKTKYTERAERFKRFLRKEKST